MSVAETFIKQLREGKTSEAIESFKDSLKEKSDQSIKESQTEVLESYGFSVVEQKDDDNDDDKKDKDDDDDDDDDLDEEGKKKDKKEEE